MPLIFLRNTFLFLSLTGCAAQVAYTQAELAPQAITDQQPLKTLTQPLKIRFDTGYERSLKAGSQWVRVGAISQGVVYKPYKDVFTLEGAHMHEAYLVVAGRELVGFYMPVERGFSPLAEKVRLEFN